MTPVHAPAARRARGFTLVEAVLVIVIIGIIGAIVAVFIRAPVQGYVDTAARAAASDEADLALRRMARDLRLSLPNSVRVNNDGSAVEFLLTKTGGRYLTLDDDVNGFPILDFDDATRTSFTAVGGTAVGIEADDFVVVYNLGGAVWPSEDPESDAYHYDNGAPGRNIARVLSVDATSENNPVITMAINPFASQASPQRSPSNRFQVVTGPVSFVCEPGQNGRNELVRYWDYDIDRVQTVPPKGSPKRAVIASNLAECSQIFRHGSDATRRSGLVILNLALQPGKAGDGAIRLVSQVHVDNTP